MLTLIISRKSSNGTLEQVVLKEAMAGHVPLFAGFDPVLSTISLDRYSTDTHALLRARLQKLDCQKLDVCDSVLVLCCESDLNPHEKMLVKTAREQDKTVTFQEKA